MNYPHIHSLIEKLPFARDDFLEVCYPERRIGSVEIRTARGGSLLCLTDCPTKAPKNLLFVDKLEAKFSGSITPSPVVSPKGQRQVIGTILGIGHIVDVREMAEMAAV